MEELEKAGFRCGLDRARLWRDFPFAVLKSGPLYFYVGAGLSTAAGLVNWGEMACTLWWYLKYYENASGVGDCPLDTGEENAEFLDNFVNGPLVINGITIADRILSHDTENWRVLGRVALLNMLLRYLAPRTKNSVEANKPIRKPEEDRTRWGEQPNAEDLILQSLIWRAKCHGVLTPNYDMLLEHAFSLFNYGSDLRSYHYDAEFLRYIISNPRFVLKLHGDINDIGTMLFNPKKAWRKQEKQENEKTTEGKLAGSHGEDLTMAYRTALEVGNMVYVGMGFRDSTIDHLHNSWREKNPVPINARVALIPKCEIADIKQDNGATNWKGDPNTGLFGDVVFLTYDEDGATPTEVTRKFLSQIVHVRNDLKNVERPPCSEASQIHRQIFRSSRDEQPRRISTTQPWSCKSSLVDEGANE